MSIGATSWRSMDDLDTRPWCDSRGIFSTIWNLGFTRQFRSRCPTCHRPLQHGFTIYTKDQRSGGPNNGVVQSLSKTGAQWKGNVIVMKNADDEGNTVTDIEPGDVEDVRHLLARYVCLTLSISVTKSYPRTLDEGLLNLLPMPVTGSDTDSEDNS